MEMLTTRCCVVGGGPAGMMLGLLLARAGVDVIVLEKHADFLRDFRGDTIHPSTLELMHELGVLDEFLKLPHEKARLLKVQVGDTSFPLADFSHLPTRCQFIALMPQWDFLNFLAKQGARYTTFQLRQSTNATGLIEEGDRVVGVRATGPEGELAIKADLVVGADGRHSVVREKAGFHVQELGAPMDVLWFRISRKAGDPEETMGHFDAGRILIMINRGSHWQFGYIIMKGSAEENRKRGLDAFREDVATLAPFSADRRGEIRNWDDVKLLTVQVDRLLHWYKPGLLCIGDAAHAMSPIGGVGVNLAVQDGVAAANLLAKPLREGALTTDHLRLVQQRRLLPTRIVQGMQVLVQKQVVSKVLSGTGPMKPPLPLKLFARFPFLRRLPARLIGVGIRPEHVRTQAAD
ncbi:MAG: FAD-dependent oxidoreductase [Nitrospirae bacterium]|nr:MAG: FAD-dependent oxidoreductase [Nitrospirota bacterium]